MKHYKNVIIHGAKLFRHLKGLTSDNGSALAKLPLADTRAVALATNSRRVAAAGPGEDAEDGDDFFSAFASLAGPFFGNAEEDEPGGSLLDALLGGSNEGSEDDFFGAFFGGGGNHGGEERGEDEGSGDDFFSSLLGGGDHFFSDVLGLKSTEERESPERIPGIVEQELGVFEESVEQCGIDLADMSGKALMAFFAESWGALDLQPVLLALKDDGEEECGDAAEAALSSALDEYLECTGADLFFEDSILADSAIQDVEEDCKPVYNMIAAGDIDVDSLGQDFLDVESPTNKSGMRCLKATLGDNDAGNFLRYQYNHLDKSMDCTRDLGEAMPRCVAGIQNQDGEPLLNIPLSLLKKSACLLGTTFKSIIGVACAGIYEGLDACLPQSGGEMNDRAISQCADERGLFPLGKQEDFFGMDASVLTGNRIPGFCTNFFEGKAMDATNIQSRLDYYNQHREYGWTIESITNDAYTTKAIKKTEGAESRTYSMPNPTGIVGEEYNTLGASEATPDTTDSTSQKKYFPCLTLGLAVFVALTLTLIVKYRRPNRGQPPTTASSSTSCTRKEYTNIVVKAIGADFA